MKNLRIISIKQLSVILNCSIPSIYRWEKNGTLQLSKIKIGKNKVGYLYSEVLKLIQKQTNEEGLPNGIS